MKVNKGQSNSAKGDMHSVLVLSIPYVVTNQVMSCHCRHLGFDRIGNSAIRSVDPENRTWAYRRTKHDVDRMTLCGDMTIRNSTYHEGYFWDPICLGKGRSYRVIDGIVQKSDGGFL